MTDFLQTFFQRLFDAVKHQISALSKLFIDYGRFRDSPVLWNERNRFLSNQRPDNFKLLSPFSSIPSHAIIKLFLILIQHGVGRLIKRIYGTALCFHRIADGTGIGCFGDLLTDVLRAAASEKTGVDYAFTFIPGYCVRSSIESDVEITKIEKARHSGSEKVPACNKAIVTFCIHAQGCDTYITENYLLIDLDWARRKMTEFFSAIGFAEKGGQRVRMHWGNDLIGRRGVCHVAP